ncbi:paramyosin-like isoform X2 [Lepisosteus oculatus]|uniref:paramyosin-like isoform X2 n=1 Tax=Lepisosteus oculatus TaxID=7918 RepID=UPI00073FD5D0|nr:PREDICTED: golgin subfamily A member 6-like protein 22 isoform X2 [Lepisosteus oculatus]
MNTPKQQFHSLWKESEMSQQQKGYVQEEMVKKHELDTLSTLEQDCQKQNEGYFHRFQLLIDQIKNCTDNMVSLLSEVTDSQNQNMGQLLSSLPQDQSRSLLELISDITYKNTELIHLLRQQGLAYTGIAKMHKEHFEIAQENDIICLEERELHDLLVQRILQVSSTGFLKTNLQEKRLIEVLKKRGIQQQEMNQILAELEEKIANHTSSWQQEHLIQEEMKGTLTMMCAAPPVYFTELERILQHEKARIHQQVEQALQISELKEERKTSQLLMKQLDSSPSKTEANLVQENQRLTESVAGREREKKLMQIKIKELESALVGAEDRVSDYKKVSIRIHREMQLLLTHIKEKEKFIKTLKKELQDLETEAEKRADSNKQELEELRMRVAMMELENSQLMNQQNQQ